MPNDEIICRPAEQSELALLPAVEEEAGRRFADQGRPDVAASPSMTMAALTHAFRDGLVWVAESEGVVCGFAVVRFFGIYAHLDEISVLPAYGRRGIGRTLLEAVCAEAVTRGTQKMTLSTFRNIPWNRPWYIQRGFYDIEPASYPNYLHATGGEDAARGLTTDDRVCMIRELRANI